MSEFGSICNLVEQHELLSKRKITENKSLDKYFLLMKQSCSQGNIEGSALIQCYINDSVFKKSFSYGCHNIHEFNQKLKIYEKLRNDYYSVKPPKPEVQIKPRSKPVKTEICDYNCCGNSHEGVNLKIKVPFVLVGINMGRSLLSVLNQKIRNFLANIHR